ncbi:MAG: DUF393 domain-containing protein [Thermoguttaceae bacterium]|nr:DUF393 domain-containing protein [Thermoguttaceae bacterium]
MERQSPIRLFYDGQCPFCRREAEWLKRRDRNGRILWVDINDPVFDPADYGLTGDALRAALHAILPDGRVVRGVDAIQQLYRALGLSWLVAPLSWPGIRWMAGLLYGLFARYRVPIGKMLSRRCGGGSCSFRLLV